MNGSLAAHIIVLVCMGSSAPPAPPERVGPRVCELADDAASVALAARTEAALRFMSAHGLTPAGPVPVVAVGALSGEGATDRAVSVADAAAHGLGERWAGVPALLLEAPGPGSTSEDPEALLHELVHIWLRSRGAPEPAWATRVSKDEPGVIIATRESGVIEEALADFITASRSRSPVLYRASARPGTPARSVRGRGARCPEAFSGRPHADASVLSGALWDVVTRHGAEAHGILLTALAKVAPSHTHEVRALAKALTAELKRRAPKVARVWAKVVDERGLGRCQEPISLTLRRTFQSPLVQPVIPGKRGDTPMASLQRYEVQVSGSRTLSVGVRFDGQAPPNLRWDFVDARGRRVDASSSVLDAQTSSMASTRLAVPPRATRLLFRLSNPQSTPIAFDDIKVISVN